jgi:hypothetical protein
VTPLDCLEKYKIKLHKRERKKKRPGRNGNGKNMKMTRGSVVKCIVGKK